MLLTGSVILVLAVTSGIECVRNTPRSARASRNEGSLEFECPEEFGYYPHPRDCTQYYVCVFGGALLESCTGGLMYSHELQTCDWPRNVGCLNGGGIAKETEEDDPLLERATKAEYLELQEQPQHHQSRHQQRQPTQRQQQQHHVTVTSSSPSVSQITERQHSRQRQQPQQRTYVDDEYEPATEIESDRQQRVYRGQPSTIGQVQRDRDGLRRNIISVSHQPSSSSSSSLLSTSSSSSSSIDGSVTPRQDAPSYDNIVNRVATRRDRIAETTRASSTLSDVSLPIHRQPDHPSEERESESDERSDNVATSDDTSSVSSGSTTPTVPQPRIKDDFHAVKVTRIPEIPRQTTPSLPPTLHQRYTTSGDSRPILQQPRSRTEERPLTSPTSVPSQWQRSPEEFEKNEISLTSPSSRQRGTTLTLFSRLVDEPSEETPGGFPAAARNVDQRQRARNDAYRSSSTPSWPLRSTEELEKNEISVSPGPAGRGFMVKRLRFEDQDAAPQDGEVYVTSQLPGTDQPGSRHQRGESRNLQVSVDPPSIRQRTTDDSLAPSTPQTRATEKTYDSTSAKKATFDDPENRKYYAVTIPRGYPTGNLGATEPSTTHPQANVFAKTRKIPVNPIPFNATRGNVEEKKYYIPSVHQQRAYNLRSEKAASSVQPPQGRENEIPDRKETRKPRVTEKPVVSSEDPEVKLPGGLSTSERSPEVPSSWKNDENSVKTMIVTTMTTTISSSSRGTESDPAKNEVSDGFSTSVGSDANETEGNEIPSSNYAANGSRGRQRSYARGQTRRKTQEEKGGTSRPVSPPTLKQPRARPVLLTPSAPTFPDVTGNAQEREKDSVVNPRGQTESHYRAISSESPRIVKTTVSTRAPISKSYYSDADQSYPYYTIYDDDVSIYKDDDYAQYSVNRTVQLQQQQPQLQHHHHQHQNVRIAEVTPNSNQYTQKPKKIAVNDADKYNLNPEVTVSDYDLYDNQPLKNKFRISDGQQSLRTNGLSHPAVHVTTPNAIVDNYVPLTSTTQPPPTTTIRPYTVTVQNRGRPQVNRGTAPPRLRPTLKPSTAIVSKAQEYVDIYRYPPSRPGPIYPTPTVDKPAAKCRKDVCLLPDCNCGGTDIPGGLPAEKIPQIVLLTFDDAVNDLNKQLYEDLFERGRKNPNGCPISATFYVSHEWTDYSQVQNLYADGHELASHTVSHSFGEQFSARKWSREVAGQREILAAYGGVKLEDVRGMRAPFLSVGGNNMFKMLWDTNFTYDSSMPIYENRPPSWPYTLDYKLFHDCMIPPCPTRSYPGLWEVPMVMWQDLNGGRCSMGDACSNPPTSDGVYKMLIKNFERHYTTNRAPFGLFYHAAWFTQPHHKEGFISFLDTIVAMDDVWVVTNWQAIQWVRNPTPLQLLDRFEPFACNYADRPKKCNNAKVCNLWHKSGVRYMKTCQACPDIYPWTGKTGIRSSRIDNEVEK